MVWDPFCPYHLYCSLENGEIVCIDIRIPLMPLTTFQAHDKTTSSISFSSGVSGLFASASIDKTVKLWDVSNIQKTVFESGGKKAPTGVAVEGLEPHLVMYKTMNVGKLFTLQYYSDDPFVLATAGDKGSVAVWECDEAENVKNHFKDRIVGSSNSGVYSSLINASSDTADAAVGGNVPKTNIVKNIPMNYNNSMSVSEALELPGHKGSVIVPEVDDSWMDESEPTPSKIEKKSKKSKSKDKDKVKKEKK